MTNWTDFPDDLNNSVFIHEDALQQIVDNTTNIYERINVLESLKGGGVPVSGIMLWTGTLATIPQGYQLADGTNGTPDLRGKFLMGIASTETDNNLLETGGSTQHTQAMGAVAASVKHKHTVYLNDSSASVSAQSGVGLAPAMTVHNHSWSARTNDAGEHIHTGTYAAANHLPPHTKYYWIARIPA